MAVHTAHPIAAPPAAPVREKTSHQLLRGWCIFERRLSCVRKHGGRCLTLSRLDRHAVLIAKVGSRDHNINVDAISHRAP